MPLETMTTMLHAARAGRYAVGAFNILDYNSMRAVVRAAEEARRPVILQTSVKTVEFWGARTLAAWAREIAGASPVPVALHLDHCQSVDMIGRCLEAGWSSVMIDASAKPFEENLALTRDVVKLARRAGASVEAELGEIVGVEDDKFVNIEDSHLADPDRAEAFCRQAPIDCLAPAVGTAHGLYEGEPRIAFDRIEAIARRTGIPLALHGGTGLADDVFRKCIAMGCAKVNISTLLKHVFIDSFIRYYQAHPTSYNPLKVLNAQCADMQREVGRLITLFGKTADDGER
jgi:ketose-bisphosphate aldolase